VSALDPQGAYAHNLDVARGLREVADFLEQHSELPRAKWATITLRYHIGDNSPARETLTLIAQALGEKAVEKEHSSEVIIEGRFAGNVRVDATAKRSELVDAPPDPVEYEPIIPVQS
jgi:hypothetical protein